MFDQESSVASRRGCVGLDQERNFAPGRIRRLFWWVFVAFRSAAHAFEHVAVQRVHDFSLPRLPEPRGPQVADVASRQDHLGVVRVDRLKPETAVDERHIVFEVQVLLGNAEFQSFIFHAPRDLLHQLALLIDAALHVADRCHAAFGANRPWQRELEQEWRLVLDLLVEHDAVPRLFARRVKRQSGFDGGDRRRVRVQHFDRTNAIRQCGEQQHGQEMPMHEPRLKAAMGLGYAISPTGADHNHNIHDTVYTKDVSDLTERDPSITAPLPANDLSSDKVKFLVAESNWTHFYDSAVMCIFLPYANKQMVDLMNSVTGWDGDIPEYLRLGARVATLARIVNVREGWSAAGDTLPKRIFKAFDSGPLAGQEYPEDRFHAATQAYYNQMGWDENGVPTKEKLRELGIESVVSEQ